ncbi:UDP-glucose 4-epimerase GalE [Bacillus toyonensis]|uniref:UDP-glucose 4-epimerase GalE n=1 Tax=Bacillus toyonensis TaxID=155322 RepID=UPI000BEFE23D|nr:UDP-glucose 4-epimerase GalE [Bacillus toyonensis]PEK06750.1 UDP-glucose 4-epimerase GalE [Bacillus toyonensis]PGA49364.1 UDP-glucose 4-epimerase GalE [Bacillus toyonensis]PGB94370.1 UDP-glucose 4-epimerase GalE [Bacillus toyonensis]HDX9658099.1 UDP-glucose 4-epimerase GalE [Bacillus toyonensis]
MTVLVLGGAGYIGSHAVNQLITNGYDVAVIDNLLTGHIESLHEKARFYKGDIRDKKFMCKVFSQEKNIEGLMHFAAFSLVGESMEEPLKYFNNNVYGTQITLEVMREFGVKYIVFSSTAATFGIPEEIPIKETTPTKPINPYGQSKLMMEQMMKWQSEASDMNYVALRYFNVAGAKEDGSIGEAHNHETHLIPIILQVALGQRDELIIYGDDYNTPDGTNIRDYIQVIDLIDAHIKALEYLKVGGKSDVFNLGSAQGFSNKEMLKAAREVTGHPIPAKIGPRRPGDPDVLIASSAKAKEVLGWEPKYTSIKDIIATAWKWHQSHPEGY